MTYNASNMSNKAICHSLDISPFDVEYNGWHFRFSTEKHMMKFQDEILMHKEWLDDSISRRFHIDFDSGMLAAVSLYRRIEGRGFYMYNKAKCITYRDSEEVYMRAMM